MNHTRANAQIVFNSERFREAQMVTGLDKPEDLLNYALTMICWAARQAKTGRVIAGLDETNGKYRELSMPFLEELKKQSGR